MANPLAFPLELMNRLKKIPRKKSAIVALTGAGISAPSGASTFRDAAGNWIYPRRADLARPEAFKQDPEEVWSWYAARIERLMEIKPNPAHKSLVTLEKEGYLEYIITQNVDSLHRMAGSSKIIKLHGDIFHFHCMNCNHQGEIKALSDLSIIPPHCPLCNSIVRPSVVWYGEPLDPGTLQAAISAVTNATLCLVIGTSSLVIPAANLPLYAKQQNQAILLEFNLGKTAHSSLMDHSIIGDVSVTLPLFVEWFLK